jgi:hypothetical protein
LSPAPGVSPRPALGDEGGSEEAPSKAVTAKTDAIDLVRRILAFDRYRTMPLRKETIVTAAISLTAERAKVLVGTTNDKDIGVQAIDVAKNVKAVLRCDNEHDFKISLQSEPVQGVSWPNDEPTWRWRVTAMRPQAHTLLLDVCSVDDAAHCIKPTPEQTIRVEIEGMAGATAFVGYVGDEYPILTKTLGGSGAGGLLFALVRKPIQAAIRSWKKRLTRRG